MKEYTYVMIKPDVAGNRDIVEAIKIMLERIGMEIVLTLESEDNPKGYLVLDDKTLEEHYGHVKKYGMDIYNSLVEFMKSGYVVPMVLYGENAIESVRKLVGCTDSTKAEPGTIRKVFGTDKQRNAIHASDSKESVEVEIPRFFNGVTVEDLEDLRRITETPKTKTKKLNSL